MATKTNYRPWKRKEWHDVVSIDVKYRDKERTRPEICIWRRTPAGKSMVTDPDGFPSYFYVPFKDAGKIDEMPKDLAPDSLEYPDTFTLDGKRVVKLVYPIFSKEQFKSARDFFPITYEDDVKYLWRYMLDNDITFAPERRICYLDIETDMSVDTLNAPAPVLSIAVYDTFSGQHGVLVVDDKIPKKTQSERIDEKRFIVKYKTEVELLNGFIKYVQTYNPDVLCAYNLNEFDFPYLINRMKKCDVNYRNLSEIQNVYSIVDPEDQEQTRSYCGGRELIDWYILMKKLYDEDKPEDFKLNTVGDKLLQKRKVKHPYRDLKELYQRDLPLFIEYNLQDVVLLKELEDKIGFITKYFTSLQKLIPMPMAQLKDNSVALDFYILKRYNNRVVFPSKRRREKTRFKGAMTGRFIELPGGKVEAVAPEKKLYVNVGVLDFSGMYPNIFRTFNISPETLTIAGMPDTCEVMGHHYLLSRQGLLPALVENIIDLRAEYTKVMETLDPNGPEYPIYYNLQYGVKRLNNSLFGACGYSGFRLFDKRVAESITGFGRFLITKVFLHLKNVMHYEVLYSDTDSVFLQLRCDVNDREATEKEIEGIEHEINEMIEKMVTDMGCPKNYMKMDFEKRFTSVIFMGVKKRYIGKADLWKGKWLAKQKEVIKGFDLVRREMSPICKEIVKKVIFDFIELKKPEDIRTYYQNRVKDVRTMPIIDIAWSKGLGKNLDQYGKFMPQHVKACLAGEQHLNIEFRKGDFPKLMYVKEIPYTDNNGNGATSDVIAFTRDTVLPEKIIQRIDYKRFIDSFIKKKLERFYGVKGMGVEEVVNDNMTLGTWFGPGEVTTSIRDEIDDEVEGSSEEDDEDYIEQEVEDALEL